MCWMLFFCFGHEKVQSKRQLKWSYALTDRALLLCTNHKLFRSNALKDFFLLLCTNHDILQSRCLIKIFNLLKTQQGLWLAIKKRSQRKALNVLDALFLFWPWNSTVKKTGKMVICVDRSGSTFMYQPFNITFQ